MQKWTHTASSGASKADSVTMYFAPLQKLRNAWVELVKRKDSVEVMEIKTETIQAALCETCRHAEQGMHANPCNACNAQMDSPFCRWVSKDKYTNADRTRRHVR